MLVVADKIAEIICLLELVLEVCPAHTDTSDETPPPLVNSSINDRLAGQSVLIRQSDAF